MARWILHPVYTPCVHCVCASCVLCSEEDDEEPLDWLPIAPEIEDPEDTGWGQLEVSEGNTRSVHHTLMQTLTEKHLKVHTVKPLILAPLYYKRH